MVANAVNLGEERLRTLINRLGPRLGSSELQERLFKTVWENLQYVGELGSLIQVREGVTRVLHDWVEQQAKQQGITRLFWPQQERQLELGTIRSDAVRQQDYQMELQRRLLEEDAAQVRRELLAGVEAAAGAGTDPAQRLFAEDTARGLKLLEVLSRRYDVVVMNPPYGSFVPQVRELVRAAYPLTYNDIYATFIDRGTQLLTDHGYLGALVYSTFKTNSTLERFRTSILLGRNPLIAMLDLGAGILDDATNKTAAIVLASTNSFVNKAILAVSGPRPTLAVATIRAPQACGGIEAIKEQVSQMHYAVDESERITFFALERFCGNKHQQDQRENMFAKALWHEIERVRYALSQQDFQVIDGSPLAYDRIGPIANLFRKYPMTDTFPGP